MAGSRTEKPQQNNAPRPDGSGDRRVIRYIALAVFFAIFCFVFALRLVKLQIIEGAPDTDSGKEAKSYEREVKITAVRGQIYDCNGTLLVKNNYTYDMYLFYDAMPFTRKEWNDTLLLTEKALLAASEDKSATISIPENLFFLDGTYPNQTFNKSVMDPSGKTYKEAVNHLTSDDFFKYFIKKYKETETDDNGEYIFNREDVVTRVTPSDIAEYYIKKYELGKKDADGNDIYTNEEKTILMKAYYRLEAATFGLGDKYLLASNLSFDTLVYVSELRPRGVDFEIKYTREYLYPGAASHILGRIGKIYEEDWDHYNELGYSMDAIVGISGCELAFESYLHGTVGIMTVIEDEKGNILEKKITTPAVAGKDVYLTIDIGMQIEAERSLADAIAYTVENSKGEGTLTGEDCNAGAIVAVTTKGEVRAIASYPTFDLSTYNEDYDLLYQDKNQPLYNRALQGLYAPGSTFKFGMALATLNENILGVNDTVYCSGVYRRFQDYQPTCWIYNMYGQQHGYENVSHALRDSCNCYFYEAGFLLGIEKMNEYCKIYGLGEHTGIELFEEIGIVAGPEYRDDNDLDPWVAGDTLSAAIGQSNNSFTPLQIAMYTTLAANGGPRYSAHLLSAVYTPGSTAPDYIQKADLLASLSISSEHMEAVRKGMYDVINDASVNYSSYKHFMDLDVIVAGKTGTAQVSPLQSHNGLMTTFAPFDNPELVVTCVLEKANSGSNCGRAIAGVYRYVYGSIDKNLSK